MVVTMWWSRKKMKDDIKQDATSSSALSRFGLI